MPKPTKQTYGAEMLAVLSTIFDQMDSDGDGEVTASEMKATLPSVSTTMEEGGFSLDEATIERIIDYFDMSADGEVDKDEFTSAGMLLMVKSMFDLYDVNRNGALSKEEFDVLMDELGYTGEDRLAIFNRADINKDGTIDEMEFYQALMGSICVDNMPNRIKLTLSQLDLGKNPAIQVFDLLDSQRITVDQDYALVLITIWVQREENRFYKAEFPIKVTNKESENLKSSVEKNWEQDGVSFDLDDFFFQNSANLEPKAKVQLAGLVEMGEAENVTIGVRLPVTNAACGAASSSSSSSGAVCWDLALPIRVQTMANWHQDRLQTIAGKVIARAAEED